MQHSNEFFKRKQNDGAAYWNTMSILLMMTPFWQSVAAMQSTVVLECGPAYVGRLACACRHLLRYCNSDQTCNMTYTTGILAHVVDDLFGASSNKCGL